MEVESAATSTLVQPMSDSQISPPTRAQGKFPISSSLLGQSMHDANSEEKVCTEDVTEVEDSRTQMPSKP